MQSPNPYFYLAHPTPAGRLTSGPGDVLVCLYCLVVGVRLPYLLEFGHLRAQPALDCGGLTPPSLNRAEAFAEASRKGRRQG